MDRLRSLLEVVREWLYKLFAPDAPLSVIDARRPRRGKLSDLYVLSTDFPIAKEHEEMLDKELDRLRAKYGVDFAVFGPGIRIVPFEDFCNTPAPVRLVPVPRMVPRRLADGVDLPEQGGS